MSDKNNIDDLFKRQLQDFEAAPSPEVWTHIQAKLRKEKEDRKIIIPLWWKLGGVAAVLALLLVSTVFFDPFGNNSNTIIVTEETEKDATHQNSNPAIQESIQTDVIANEDPSIQKEGVKEGASEKVQKNLEKQINTPSRNDKAVAEEEVTIPALPQNQERINRDAVVGTTTQKEAVANTSENKKQATQSWTEKSNTTTPDTNTKVASETLNNKGIPKNNQELIKKDVLDRTVNPDAKKTGIAVVEKQVDPAIDPTLQQKNIDLNKQIQQNASEEKNTLEAVAAIEKQKEEEDNKKSIFDAIEESETTEVAVTEDSDGRNWEVTPNFGPVFYSSLSDGSSIDPTFSDNSQSADTNYSYGVQVSYAVSDRLSIRSGVHNVNLGYTTNDIELATGPVTAALTTVDYGARAVVLTALDKGTLDQAPTPGMNPFENLRPKSTGGNASLTQNLSYYEIPLELNYALLDSRFGIDMIGGFSTLLLGDNEIVATDGDFREVLGGANNLNSVSFSTNVGIGFNYKISKRLQFNLEPMFKYQLNPYTDSSVDFKPYYLGVYSGLSFKF